jgi:hypothetical protein
MPVHYVVVSSSSLYSARPQTEGGSHTTGMDGSNADTAVPELCSHSKMAMYLHGLVDGKSTRTVGFLIFNHNGHCTVVPESVLPKWFKPPLYRPMVSSLVAFGDFEISFLHYVVSYLLSSTSSRFWAQRNRTRLD